jgi:hypothetical protein
VSSRSRHTPEGRESGETAPISWLTPIFVLITLGLMGALVWWGLTQPQQSPSDVSPQPSPTRFLLIPTPVSIAGKNTPRPQNQIGIIAGHNRVKQDANGADVRDLDGPFDSGATCDGQLVMEANITLDVARRVAEVLRTQDKLDVELLGEFDPRLRGFLGAALVSLHVDACIKGFSGYKVARLVESQEPAVEDRLVNCLRDRYQSISGLSEHRNTITPDMQEYHAFREIALTTPAAIIEMGFLRDDQSLLLQGDLPVQGVVEGIRCFLKGK